MMNTPERPEWKPGPADGTLYCEHAGWAALVAPGQHLGRPGWNITVWLLGREMADAHLARDHFSSETDGVGPRRSLVWALQYTEGILRAKANGSRT
jgi:hypothetical protein